MALVLTQPLFLGRSNARKSSPARSPYEDQLSELELPVPAGLEVAMYVVIRKFNRMSSVAEAARRAESGLGQMLKQTPGFQGYCVFDAGEGVGGSISLFENREAAIAANEKALTWIRASLTDVIDGEPEITMGEVLATLTP
jgi:hypothetical protein